MQELLNGYRRFRAEAWPRERARFEALADRGQSPRALVVACSDSRVDPQMILGAAPGELFVVRNVANLIPAYAPDAAYHGTSAALEFAVRALEVRDIVVMGHALCGGIRALLEGPPAPVEDFVRPWMTIAEPARRRVLACEAAAPPAAESRPENRPESRPESRQERCEHAAVEVSLSNLLTFPWVRERVEDGRLRLHGLHFDIRTGVLARLEAGRFVPVAAGD